ncbi:MAG: tRNA glutamyl-Q(34) synthetase GluQRS [Oscillospiraceae bacterium]|nr:tRNA glutamyl-Q(34) synthetase GluQRS [Oscillospiraceae bacterium]
MENTVGRFAPTPSGRMHLGNVFCALLSWLSAKSKGGRIVLRIEDLDTQRAPRHFADLLEQDFRWLGLVWDEGGSTGGPHMNYYQSERTEIYLDFYDRLEKMGLIYPCFCSRAELHSAEAPHMSDGRFLYTGRCRDLTPDEQAALRKTRKPAARVRVPEKTVFFDDLHYGPQKEDLFTECGDFVIRRGDGVFAYQLATAIDDALMGVTEVIRGNDLLSSSPRQIWLQQTLGLPSPAYGHIPLLTAPDGRRLSKRDGDLDLGALQQRFPGPEPIIGMLGYLAGLIDRPEPVKAEELIPLFDWKKVPKGDISMTAEMLDELQR